MNEITEKGHATPAIARASPTTPITSVLVVGAGPAGLTAAAALCEQHHKPCIVTILEASGEVGGISKTVERDGYRFDIGGHRFFSKNTAITNWWKRRLPDDFIQVRRMSRIYYRGRFFDYPLKPMNALRNLGLITSIACVASYCKARIVPIAQPISFEDWVSNHFGRKLFNIFFKTYTEKVWGMPCAEISADWAAQRIKGLSLSKAVLAPIIKRRVGGDSVIKTLIDKFDYPRLGPGQMWAKTRSDIESCGGKIEMGHTVTRILTSGNLITQIESTYSTGQKRLWEGCEFILSMPLRETALAFDPPLPLPVREAAGRLRYRDFITVALVITGENPFPDNWIYIHEPGVKVGRIQNFKNWSADMVPDEAGTCLGLEYFCFEGDGLWIMPDHELVALAQSELTKLGLLQNGRICRGYVVRQEKAYPVYQKGYAQDVAIIRNELRRFTNLQVAGRNGMHKYNNQDHSMMTALLAADNISRQKAHDLWSVNTDAEYHEESTGLHERAGRQSPERLDPQVTPESR